MKRINTNFIQTLAKTDKGTLSNSFCELIITFIPKSDKDIARKKTFEYRCKNVKENTSK